MWLLWDSNPRSECTWTWNKPLWPLGKTAYVFLFPFLLYPLWPLGYRGFTPWVGFEPTKHNAADFVSENNELLLGKMFIVFRCVRNLFYTVLYSAIFKYFFSVVYFFSRLFFHYNVLDILMTSCTRNCSRASPLHSSSLSESRLESELELEL